MPDALPDSATRTDEQRAAEAAYRRAYRRGFRKRTASKNLTDSPRESAECVPTDSLAVLLGLPVSDPDTIPRLARGLRWHVAYGTVTPQSAAQIVRLAELERASLNATPKADPLASAISAITATTPPKQDD